MFLGSDHAVMYDSASGLLFSTESQRKELRLAPTPSVKEDQVTTTSEVASWGDNNDYPQRVAEEVRTSDLLRPLIHKAAKRMMGRGLSYGTIGIDEDTGADKPRAMRILEIDQALRRTNERLYSYTAWVNWLTHGNVFAELQKSYGGDVVGVYCQDTTRCRLSKKEKGRIKHCYIGGKWAVGGTEKEATKVHAIDPFFDQAGQVAALREPRCIVPIRLLVDDHDYYGVGQWHGLIEGGYLDLAKVIIKSKRFLAENLAHIRYHLEVGSEYWPLAYPGFKDKTDAEKRAIKQAEKDKFTKWITGQEKAGRVLMTERILDEIGPKKEYRSLWKITSMKLDIPTGAYVEDSAEVDSKIIRAFMDASLFGATPSKDRNSAGSGSDKQVAHLQEVADNLADADLVITPFDIMATVNRWHEKYGNGQMLRFWYNHPSLDEPVVRPKQD